MRGRLSLVALAITSMVVIAFLVPLGLLVANQARNRALDGGQQTARSVAAGLSVAGALSGRIDTPTAELVVTISGDEATSVFLPDGTVVGAPSEASAAVDLAAGGRALTADADGGVEILVPVTGTADTVIVRTFVSNAELTDGVLAANAALAALGILLIGAAVVLADRLGRNLVKPVTDLAATARRMAGGDLDARVEPSGPPEMADVGAAFNHLAERIAILIAEERESLADLSHGLRTPLTALRLQVEMLADETQAGPMLEDIDRLSAQVDGLIAEARRTSPASGPREALLCETVRERFGFWEVLAVEQGRDHGLTVLESPISVALTPADLTAAVDVLFDNVFTHTQPGTAYRVRVTATNRAGILTIEDDGPGYASGDVLERGSSSAGSTGLGLDIVKRAAERSGGGVEIGAGPAGGARLVVSFGRASSRVGRSQ